LRPGFFFSGTRGLVSSFFGSVGILQGATIFYLRNNTLREDFFLDQGGLGE
jgi:hypothetical protein